MIKTKFKPEEWKDSFKWGFEAYPFFTSVYQKLASPTKEKYFVQWTRFLNYFNKGQLKGYVPKEEMINRGYKTINELLRGKYDFIKKFDTVNEEMQNAINKCLEIRKKREYHNLEKWWPITQRALSDIGFIIFSFDFTLNEFLETIKKENPKDFKMITKNLGEIKESFINEANRRLTELIIENSGDFEIITPLFIEEYGWFQNSYKGKFRITKEWLKKYSNTESKNQLKEEKIKLDNRYELLIEAANKAITYRDEKKKLLLITVDLMESWLREMCIKNSWDYENLKWLSMDEILILINKRDKELLIKANNYNNKNKRIGVMTDGGYIDVEESIWNSVENIHKVKSDIKIIKGTTGSRGIAKGRIRVMLDAKDTDSSFKKGDILVTSMTRPEFLPLMKKAAAIITDEGGITCHAAIVSRELGIPCITGTKNSTQILKDRDLVEVNADKGIVKIIKKA